MAEVVMNHHDEMESLAQRLANFPSGEFESLFCQVQEYVGTCSSERIHASPDIFTHLCRQLAQAVISQGSPIRGISVLSMAIRKLRTSETHLTSLHSELCRLCLVAKCFKPALEFMDIDITDITHEGGLFETKSLLLYYYYGGMIYTALKQYEKALQFLEVVITTPASVVSHIMLEAYKKFILISLINSGSVRPLPKYTSHVICQYVRPLSTPYLDLVSAYGEYSAMKVRTVVVQNQEAFTRDSNMGLVKQVAASVYRRCIARLTRTFLTLTLRDVAHLVQLSGPKEAEMYIVEMIESGDIHATINQKDGMVIFHEDQKPFNCPSMLKDLQSEVSKCKTLAKQVRKMEEAIMLDTKYVKKCSNFREEGVPTTSPTNQPAL